MLQNIALSPAELGDLIDIISGAPAKMIYHDPNKGRAGCVPALKAFPSAIFGIVHVTELPGQVLMRACCGGAVSIVVHILSHTQSHMPLTASW